jgi:hypothetical protein
LNALQSPGARPRLPRFRAAQIGPQQQEEEEAMQIGPQQQQEEEAMQL